jgi:hypothetical protein
MTTQIRLNEREIDRVHDLFHRMNTAGNFGSVVLTVDGETEIGSRLKATFYIEHEDVDGDFTVTITDESDW